MYPTGQILYDFMRKPVKDMTPKEKGMWGVIWFENHQDQEKGKKPRHNFYEKESNSRGVREGA